MEDGGRALFRRLQPR